jgi:integrase
MGVMAGFEVRSGKYAALWARWSKEDQDFVRWLQKFDSEDTQRNYWQRIAELNERTKLTPKEIVARYKTGGDTRQTLLDDIDTCLNALKKEGKVATARMIWAAVVSLLIHRGALAVQRQFELKQPMQEKVTPQYIPTQKEFEAMLRFALCARDRYLAAQFRYSGGRRGVIDDPEPMRLSNVLDLDLEALRRKEGPEIKFKHQTTCAILLYGMVNTDGQIQRYTDTYVSFLAPQAMTFLKEYLEERIRKGEQLTPESYLFTPERHDVNVNGRAAYLKPDQASRIISNMSTAAGFAVKNEKSKKGELKGKYSAHSLRRLFYNSLHGIDDVDKEALDGHIKGVRARYHGSVDEMKKVIELMRERYEQAIRDLLPATSEESAMKVQVAMFKAQYEAKHGHPLSPEKERLLEDIMKTTRTVDDRLKRLAAFAAREDETATGGKTAHNGGSPVHETYETRIVGEVELVPLLNQGWDIVKELTDGRVIVRRLLDHDDAVSEQ